MRDRDRYGGSARRYLHKLFGRRLGTALCMPERQRLRLGGEHWPGEIGEQIVRGPHSGFGLRVGKGIEQIGNDRVLVLGAHVHQHDPVAIVLPPRHQVAGTNGAAGMPPVLPAGDRCDAPRQADVVASGRNRRPLDDGRERSAVQ